MIKLPEIVLSADETDRLKRRLIEMIESAESFRKNSEWDSLHALYWRMHLGAPENAFKDWPWPNASNLFLPLTGTMTHAVVAQEFDALLSADPKVIGFEASDLATADDLTAYYFDYYFKEVIPLQTLGADWLLDNVVDGTSAVKVRQNRDFVVRREQEIKPVYKQVDMAEYGGLPGETVEEISDYEFTERPTISRVDRTEVNVVDLDKIYVAPQSGPDLNWPVCPWYYETNELTWEDLIERRRQGYKVSEKLKAWLAPAEPTEKEEMIHEEIATDKNERHDTLNICEFYMRWPLPARYQMDNQAENGEKKGDVDQSEGDEEGYMEEVVVTYAPGPDEILLIRPLARVSPDGTRPHIVNHYHRTNARYFYGIGVPSRLKYVQEALNTNWNQLTDYGTLSNIPFFLYSPALAGNLASTVGIQPGRGIEVNDPRGVVFPRFNTDPGFFLSSQQQLQTWGEKLAAIGDINLGRSPTTPNAPRTARGMAYQIQQSNIAFSILVALHAQPFIAMLRKVHAFHKRWAKAETTYRIMNKETGMFDRRRLRAEDFRQEVDFRFTLNTNRMSEAQTNMALYQMTVDGIARAMQQPQLAASIRAMLSEIWVSAGKKNFDSIWPPKLIPDLQLTAQTGAPMQQTLPAGAPGLPAMSFAPAAGEGPLGALGAMGGEMPVS